MDRCLHWRPPPLEPTLGGDEVHVWQICLDLAPAQVQALRLTLAAEELARVLRFRFQRDRERFIAARGLLRAILGWYLGMEPGQVRFCYGPQGKPHLVGERGQETLRFNLAHSADLALLAVTRGREVGVDVEEVQPQFDWAPLADQFFCPQEVTTLRTLPGAKQVEAFFACWTRKEAYLKARGDGLAQFGARTHSAARMPLARSEVSLAPGQPDAPLWVEGYADESSRWALIDLKPLSGYVGALAVEGVGWQLKCWHYSPEQFNAERILETRFGQK